MPDDSTVAYVFPEEAASSSEFKVFPDFPGRYLPGEPVGVTDMGMTAAEAAERLKGSSAEGVLKRVSTGRKADTGGGKSGKNRSRTAKAATRSAARATQPANTSAASLPSEPPTNTAANAPSERPSGPVSREES